MKKPSLSKRIERYLERHQTFIHKGRIEELVKAAGYLAETGNRICRELAAEGKIERKEENGSVLYRALPKDQIIRIQEKLL